MMTNTNPSLYRRIIDHLADPKAAVIIATYLRATEYRSKHVGLFVEPKSEAEREIGVYVRQGRRLVFVDTRGCAVRFGRYRRSGASLWPEPDATRRPSTVEEARGSSFAPAHPTKPGTVTLAFHGRNTDVPVGTAKSILKAAGLEEK